MGEAIADAVYTCPDCGDITLIILDAGEPGLVKELEEKVDNHVCKT